MHVAQQPKPLSAMTELWFYAPLDTK